MVGLRRVALLAVAISIGGCADQTYWGFPAGRTIIDFRADEAQCRSDVVGFGSCLSARGYRQISNADFMIQQQAALERLRRPIEIVAYDVKSREILVGKSQPQPGAKTSSVDLSGIGSDISCTGYAEVTKLVAGGKGSIGVADLLCKDGRQIRADFVYDSPTSGFGRGADGFEHAYLFKFGRLDLDLEKLREEFREMQEQEQRRQGEHHA